MTYILDFTRRFAAPLLLAAMVLAAAGAAAGPAPGSGTVPWLLVDTRDQTLAVMRADRAEIVFDNIAIGRFGTSRAKRRADNTTPLGRFRITEIRQDSDFHRFIALDYPDLELARNAYRSGDLDARDLAAIERAHRRGDAPPQHTALGGYIGIHGLGQADPELHEAFNWTRGCVALTNAQVDLLLPLIRVGMRVEIR